MDIHIDPTPLEVEVNLHRVYLFNPEMVRFQTLIWYVTKLESDPYFKYQALDRIQEMVVNGNWPKC